VVGLDTRPATGQLFLITVPTGVAANATVRSYTLDPVTATATFVGSIPGTVPGAADSPTRMDFQPGGRPRSGGQHRQRELPHQPE
jgi:hypothetical protein